MNTSKIIRGVVSNGRYTVTAPIVKEDYGLYLKIEGVELPSTYEVDFSNDEHSGSSVTMIGNANGVRIPAQFIKSGKDVFAFLYHVGEDYGRTVFKFRIPNKLRPDRTNEQPTPEEQSAIDQTIAALNDAVDRAEDAEQAIEDMSVSATTLAEGESATVTKTEQEGVVHLEFGIPKGQTGDTPTITASKTGKTTSIYVDGSEVAQIEDGTDGIDGDDGYSPTANVSKSGKTATITITDKNGTTSAQVSDGEDGATGATPNLTIGTVETLEPSESATASITGTPENPVLNLGIPQGEQGEVTLEDYYKAFPTDTASGSIASFTDGADDLPLKSLVVNIDPVQDLSNGDPSPENICPISGWTGCEVNASGKNIFDESAYTPTNMTFVINGSEVTKNGIRLDLPSGTYTFRCNGEPVESYIYVYSFSADGTNLSRYFLSTTTAGGWLAKTITIDDGDYLILCRATSGALPLTSIDLQIELGSTPTSYEPYNGRTIPINWQTEAGTVSGGSLDVLTGKLTVYPYYASYNGETLTGRWISDRDAYAVGTTPTIGAQVVNIGAQGTEYQLDHHEIASLLGQNNIFADTGECSVEYIADTKLYINKKIAEALASLT